MKRNLKDIGRWALGKKGCSILKTKYNLAPIYRFTNTQ